MAILPGMARPKNPVPSYLLHKPSGQARVKVGGKDIYLGPYGSAESKREYERVCASLRANGGAVSTGAITVAELLSRYWDHAVQYYRRDDGKTSPHLITIKGSLRFVLNLYEDIPAAEFGPLALKEVRTRMIEHGYVRKTINSRIDKIRAVWRWAVAEELLPSPVYEALRAVPRLRAGKTAAKDNPPVTIVSDDIVDRTVKYLSPVFVAMVRTQRLTGMRPGEVCRLRMDEIDRSDAIWVYKPKQHKTAHHGRVRHIAIGPKAQQVLLPFMGGIGGSDYLFSPARENDKVNLLRRQSRKLKVYPSTYLRRVKNPKKKPGEHYKVCRYDGAVAEACLAAGVPRWSPNRLRHSFATEVRRRLGIEAAGAGLGHSKMSVTEVYAERDGELAKKVAREMG